MGYSNGMGPHYCTLTPGGAEGGKGPLIAAPSTLYQQGITSNEDKRFLVRLFEWEIMPDHTYVIFFSQDADWISKVDILPATKTGMVRPNTNKIKV
ncbi:hypothetical protein [Aeromonas bivalvium]|uniref:hypothetical protein n=1 Tax=Aeromonas bivalvium TaxID=440079 RepID=UPI0038CF70A4